MIGTGVFSTRKCQYSYNRNFSNDTHSAGSILVAVGSVGLSLIFWIIGYIFAAGQWSKLRPGLRHVDNLCLLLHSASLSVYLEYSTYFPHRSGAEVAYLEKVMVLPHGHSF